jgi:hypothetical protein
VWYGITVIDANTFSLPASTGNGTYGANSGVAQDIDPPVGYEGATWGDGTTSFLASKQGGPSVYCGNWTSFNALYQDDAYIVYALHQGNEVPNNCFGVNKRIGMADSRLDGFAQYSLIESLHRMLDGNGGDSRSAVPDWNSGTTYTAGQFVYNALPGGDGITYTCILGNTNHQPPNATYWVAGGPYTGGWSAATTYTAGQTVVLGNNSYLCILGHTNHQPPNGTYWTDVTDTANLGRQRWAVFNSGEMHLSSLLANATTTLYDSPLLRLNASYWDGANGKQYDAYLVHHMAATTPQSDFRLYMGGTGAESVKLIIADASPLYYRTASEGSATSASLNKYDLPSTTQTTNASAQQVDTAYAPPSGHAATIEVRWNAKNTVSLQTAGGGYVLTLRNNAGTLTIAGAGAATSTEGDSPENGATLAFAVSGGNTLIIQATPPVLYSGKLDWAFECNVLEN